MQQSASAPPVWALLRPRSVALVGVSPRGGAGADYPARIAPLFDGTDGRSLVGLHQGRIEELGSHEDLVAVGGRNAQLFRLQASRYEDVVEPT